ncbi:MAG: OmpA family protein [Crocinitomicaceae bacterium]|nr:OmpA family protein [Crocinitomicaceae bacterium]
MRFYFLIGALLVVFTNRAQYMDIEEPHRLGGEVNSEADELFPVFSKETSTLYYTRVNDPESIGGVNDQDIWQSAWNGEKKYAKGQDYKDLNNKYNNSIVGFNSDESIVYLINSYDGKKDLKKGISYAKKKGNSWGAPKQISIPGLDIEGDFYGFHVNKKGDVIVISYAGPKSLGEEDLYVSIKEDEKWTEPIHLGSKINSSGFEISPFLSNENDTLYFSTNGRGGQGDADIFYAVRNSDSWTDWSSPVNIGSQINSTKFDAYFTISDGFFYWSSNRDSERSDIYYSTFLPPPALMASAEGTDVSIFNGADGSIDLTPQGGVAPYTYMWSNGSKDEDPTELIKGTYEVEVKDAIGQVTKVIVDINEPAEIIEPIIEPVTKLVAVESIIYFDFNSSYHNKKNRKELNAFCEKVNNKGEVKIVIESHCDKRASEEYNIWLSKKRMVRTRDFLVSQGFKFENISGAYKGESELEINCDECTEENHTINRRTVIKVVK